MFYIIYISHRSHSCYCCYHYITQLITATCCRWCLTSGPCTAKTCDDHPVNLFTAGGQVLAWQNPWAEDYSKDSGGLVFNSPVPWCFFCVGLLANILGRFGEYHNPTLGIRVNPAVWRDDRCYWALIWVDNVNDIWVWTCLETFHN